MLEPQQIGELFDAHAPALRLYARQLCDDPEDAVQEAYLKLAEQSALPPEPHAWLFRVVRNAALMATRSARRRRNRETVVAASADWFRLAIDGGIDSKTASVALQSLTPEDRELVTARIWGGLNFRELGELVGISDSAAHRRYTAAIESLRKQLGASCPRTK